MYYVISYTHTHIPFHFPLLSSSVFPSQYTVSAVFIYRSEVVISSIWLEAFELFSIQLNFSLLPFLKSLVIYFFISTALSRISQKRQSHYQPKMCSSILLLCSDKGTARQVTRVHREPCRKQHFSHWSTVLHVNDCQWAKGESHSRYMQHSTWQSLHKDRKTCINFDTGAGCKVCFSQTDRSTVVSSLHWIKEKLLALLHLPIHVFWLHNVIVCLSNTWIVWRNIP